LNIDFAQEASKSKLRAAKLSYPVPPIASLDTINAFISTLISRSYGAAQNRKRAYVLVNPNAGPGGADRVFSREARPIFEAARMDLTVVTTTYAGEAGKLAEEMDVDAFDVVVACSGDGLPHEIFNGLGRRRDARRALGRTAVAMIPCGSGNAMAINLYGTHDPSLSALAIVKGVRTPFDLVSVTQGEERRLSFLSQALGLVAVLDITTENMRWLGSHRFTLGFLKEVLQKNLYPCDIAVKVEIEHKEGVKEHYKNKVLENNGYGNAEEGAGKSDRDSETTRMGTPGQDEEMGLPPLRYGTVRDKLPEGWELIPHEKLWSFYCGNVSFLRLTLLS
jgi:sphingosine kinase